MTNKSDNASKLIRQKPGTLSEKIANYLRDGIIAGNYVPGQRLIEADITNNLGISRGSLREAFRKLSAEGFIESIPNKGAIVRRFTQNEVQELFDIRTALETLAARLAARNIYNPKVRFAFKTAIECIWETSERSSGVSYLNENKVFHQAIANASGNTRLAELCRQMRLPLIMLQISRTLEPEVLHISNQEHRLIAEKILQGDEEGAASAIQAHLDRARLIT